jgi:hypothetical protein
MMVKDGGVAARALCAVCPGFRAFQRAQLGKGPTCRPQGCGGARAVAAEMQAVTEDAVCRVSLVGEVVVSLDVEPGAVGVTTQQAADATLLAARRRRAVAQR